jgi:hypothetical protein
MSDATNITMERNIELIRPQDYPRSRGTSTQHERILTQAVFNLHDSGVKFIACDMRKGIAG